MCKREQADTLKLLERLGPDVTCVRGGTEPSFVLLESSSSLEVFSLERGPGIEGNAKLMMVSDLQYKEGQRLCLPPAPQQAAPPPPHSLLKIRFTLSLPRTCT